jgi:hypothetical protein
MTAAARPDDDEAWRFAKLAAGKAEEKDARRLRREGRDEEAVASFERASDLYADSGLFLHEHGESELAAEVRKAIARCKKIVENIRSPKETRAAATTVRPDCLACGKPLRRYKWDDRKFSDGTPREWGDYGDNRFCGLRCGWNWACGHAPMPKTAMPKKKGPR